MNEASIILDQTRDNGYKNTPIIWYNKSEVSTYSAFCCEITGRMIDQADVRYENDTELYSLDNKVEIRGTPEEIDERFWGDSMSVPWYR